MASVGGISRDGRNLCNSCLQLTMIWQTTRFQIDLSQPRVMGIVNLTPDSFSDGGHLTTVSQALAHCERLISEGASMLDVGGESSRPGAQALDFDEESRRVMPVLREVLKLGVPISLDTTKPELMRRALDLGLDIVNDIAALQARGALEVVAGHPSCGVCLMHMQGTPLTMQVVPEYADVVAQVRDFLNGRAQVLLGAGVQASRIVLDPGIGFGKSVAHNFALLRQQDRLLDLGFALLVGWSRKSSLGAVTGRTVHERLSASVAAALLAAQKGAKVLRVHDVAATMDALKVAGAAGVLPV
jgi:dihydropteroate synthase